MDKEYLFSRIRDFLNDLNLDDPTISENLDDRIDVFVQSLEVEIEEEDNIFLELPTFRRFEGDML